MRTFILGFLTLCLTCSFGCARYNSQAPVQESNMLPTRYQSNTNPSNPNFTKDANYITNNTPTTGVRTANQVAQTIIHSYPEVEAASVIVIKKQAYVAVRLRDHKYLGNLRFQIPALVKDMEPAVEKVYVSNNPSFWKMIRKYQQSK